MRWKECISFFLLLQDCHDHELSSTFPSLDSDLYNKQLSIDQVMSICSWKDRLALFCVCLVVLIKHLLVKLIVSVHWLIVRMRNALLYHFRIWIDFYPQVQKFIMTTKIPPRPNMIFTPICAGKRQFIDGILSNSLVLLLVFPRIRKKCRILSVFSSKNMDKHRHSISLNHANKSPNEINPPFHWINFRTYCRCKQRDRMACFSDRLDKCVHHEWANDGKVQWRVQWLLISSIKCSKLEKWNPIHIRLKWILI